MTGRLRFASAADRADAGAFLARVVRLDDDALVRLRRADSAVELWAWLPLDVLVSRRVDAELQPADATVRVADLLGALDTDPAEMALPSLRDAQWRGALPGSVGWRRLDMVPSADLLALVRAGAEVFQAAARPGTDAARVGEALLDHESLTVSDGEATVAVQLRVLQALARMGFLRPDGQVTVAITPSWLRCDAEYGSAYRRRAGGLPLLSA